MHRDLKPENIFITKQNEVQLIDFGLASLLFSGKLKDACGSINQIAPEVQLQVGYDFKVDIWAFAVVAQELITGSTPWDDMEDIEAMNSIVDDDFDFRPLKGKINPKLISILKNCLVKDPDQR